jgi:hypothetical protein
MTDPVTLGVGGLGAASNAFNLIKGFVDLRDAAKVQALKFELMSLLLEAQEAQAALVSQKRDLEERVRSYEAWDGEKERYQLADVGFGTFAYVLKTDAQATEPFHMLCAECYQRRHKSVLQKHHLAVNARTAYNCHGCESQVIVSIDAMRPLGWRAQGEPPPPATSPKVDYDPLGPDAH